MSLRVKILIIINCIRYSGRRKKKTINIAILRAIILSEEYGWHAALSNHSILHHNGRNYPHYPLPRPNVSSLSPNIPARYNPICFSHEVDVDTGEDDSFELLQFQIYSLTEILPEKQKISGDGGILLASAADLSALNVYSPVQLRHGCALI